MTSQQQFDSIDDSETQLNASAEQFEHTEPLLAPSEIAIKEPSQALQMNVVLGTAPLAQVGIWGLTLAIWVNVVFRANWIFFSYHPVLTFTRLFDAIDIQFNRFGFSIECAAVAATYAYC